MSVSTKELHWHTAMLLHLPIVLRLLLQYHSRAVAVTEAHKANIDSPWAILGKKFATSALKFLAEGKQLPLSEPYFSHLPNENSSRSQRAVESVLSAVAGTLRVAQRRRGAVMLGHLFGNSSLKWVETTSSQDGAAETDSAS